MNIRDAKTLLKENLIVQHYAGSHSYGTNIASSDVDIRGLFCADAINIRTPFFNVREIEVTEEEDTKFYELTHFMKLCLECNPNIIETLWIDESDILFRTEVYDALRDARESLLSKKIAFTTTGYASAQIKRIKGHNKWITNPQPKTPPRQIDFVSLIQNLTSEKVLKISLETMCDNHRLVPYGGNVYGIIEAKGYSLYDKDFKLNTLFEEDQRNRLPLYIVKFNKEVYKVAHTKWKDYWTWKNNRNEVRSKLEEKHGYDCYSHDTEFLTKEGWKIFDDISDKDLLATVIPKTHKIEYNHYTDRFDGTFNGNMYNIKGHHTDICVTPNHNMYVREYSRKQDKILGDWTFMEAGHLPDSFDMLKSIEPKKNRQKWPVGFNMDVLNHLALGSYLRVLGWYISDGTTQFRNDEIKCVRISQSKPQSMLTQNLNKLRNMGKIDCKEYVYESTGISKYNEHVWLFPKNISECVYKDCGHKSDEKRIPSWCFELTKREMNILLTCLLQGDGTKRNHQEEIYVYYTNNSLLADDIQRLAFLCGFETSKWGPYSQESNLGVCDMYQVHINKKASNIKKVRNSKQRIDKIPTTNHRIVCFTVKNHTLVTRRNGKIAIHGNSKHGMHCVRLMRMGQEVLEGKGVLVKRPDAEELLRIRNGAWTYEEMIEYAEHMDDLIRNKLYKTSELRHKPDLKKAAELLMKLQDMVWS